MRLACQVLLAFAPALGSCTLLQPPFNCTTLFNCTCQGFADFYGTHAGQGFGCAPPPARDWWRQHHCNANGNCPCCKGPACALPDAAPCICPPPTPPTPIPTPAPPVICHAPLAPPTRTCETCRVPEFSWDTLPVFIHLSVQDSLSFDSAALSSIAKFKIATIEKWQGCHASNYTFEEEAMLEAATSIKAAAAAAGTSTAVVVWFDSYRIYSNTTLNPDAEDTTGIGCMNSRAAHFLESDSAHLLKDEKGALVLESFAHLHVVDYQRREMQHYKRDMCLNMTRSGVVDGCGVDGSHQRAGTSAIPGIAAANASRWNEAKVCMMNATTAAIGAGLVLGKMPWELGGAAGYVNGIIQEGCDNSNATVTNLRAVSSRSRQLGGARPVFECHADCAGAACESHIAAFLVGAGANAYWGQGGWSDPDSSQVPGRWMPEFFEKPLGTPLADATYDAQAQVWTRSFARGARAWFSAANNSGGVEWSVAF